MKTKPMLLMAAIMILGISGSGIAKNQPEKTNTTHRAVFQVENLTCGACFTRINQALSSLEGFSGMGANLLRKLVAVDFNAPLTAEEIGTAISGLGYPASLESTEYPGEKETFAYLQSKGRGYGGGGCCGGAAPQAGSCSGSVPSDSSGSKSEKSQKDI